jgi:16S rRNA (guanine966-N2)-methyltransferase
MRVVAGTARGRRLAAPRDDAVRPTGDRVREAVFNALHSQGAVVDAAVLDLFAGTGALGIEALSRGAAHATFVECSRAHAALVEDNLATCGFTDRADVVVADAERWLSANPGRWDLALLDPPYAYDGWTTLLAALDAAVAVVESDREVEVPAGWHVGRVRRYAGTVVMLLSPEPGDPGSSRP